MDKPVSRGKFNVGHGLLLVLLAVGLFFLSRYFFLLSFSFHRLQTDRFIAAIIFTCLFTYFLIRGLAGYKAVDIYRHHVEIKWLWGLVRTKLYASEISRASISPAKICLRKSGKDIVLTPRLMNNEAELKAQLERWQIKRKDNLTFNEEDRLANTLIKIIGGVLCAAVFYNSCMHVREPIAYDSLVKIQGHLSKPARVDTDVDLHLFEYPSNG